jgi:hypothetical protein
MKKHSTFRIIVALLACIAHLVGLAQEKYNALRASQINPDWIIPAEDQFLVLTQPPGFKRMSESRNGNVLSRSWQREGLDKSNGLQETLKITAIPNAKEAEFDVVKFMAEQMQEELRKKCKSNLHVQSDPVEESRFHLMRHSCGAFSTDGFSVSGLELIFTDRKNLYLLGWVIHDQPEKTIPLDDPKWLQLLNAMMPIYTCTKRTENGQTVKTCLPIIVEKKALPTRSAPDSQATIKK